MKRLPPEGHIRIPNPVVSDYLGDLVTRHLRVLLVVWSFVSLHNRNPWLEFTHEELATWTRLRSRDTNRAIAELVAGKLLPEPEKRGRWRIRFDRAAIIALRDHLGLETDSGRRDFAASEAEPVGSNHLGLGSNHLGLESHHLGLETDSGSSQEKKQSSKQEDACLPACSDREPSGSLDRDRLISKLQKYHVKRADALQWASAQPTAVTALLGLFDRYSDLVAENPTTSPIKNPGGFIHHSLDAGDAPTNDLWSLEWEGTAEGLLYFLQCLAVSHKKKTGDSMPLPQPWDLPAVRDVLQSFINSGWGRGKLTPLTYVVWELGGGSTAARKTGLATAIAKVWGQLQPVFADWLAAEGDNERRHGLLETTIDFWIPDDA